MTKALIGSFLAAIVALTASATGHLIFFGIGIIAVCLFNILALTRENKLNDRMKKLEQELDILKRRV